MIMTVFILFSPQNVTMFYAHFSIFKLKLDLQYRYARAQLTVRGRGQSAGILRVTLGLRR